jgi:hypothetical protein
MVAIMDFSIIGETLQTMNLNVLLLHLDFSFNFGALYPQVVQLSLHGIVRATKRRTVKA